MRILVCLTMAVLLLGIAGCTTKGDTSTDPREIVINMIRAVEDHNRDKLAHYIDFATLLANASGNITLSGDEPQKITNPKALLDEFDEGGQTRDRWLAMQRIVGDSEIKGDTAFVEVSFISKETGVHYYNKWGLHKMQGVWKIYSFGVMAGD